MSGEPELEETYPSLGGTSDRRILKKVSSNLPGIEQPAQAHLYWLASPPHLTQLFP